MIAQVELHYSAAEKLVELSEDPEVYESLRQIFTNAPSGENRDKSYYWERVCLIDLVEDAPKLLGMGITFEVQKIKGTIPLQAILPDGKHYEVYVQVPHVGLLAVDEVQLEENCCTDRLQLQLDNGWRILCVCPPNAARRPDYILGRTKPQKL